MKIPKFLHIIFTFPHTCIRKARSPWGVRACVGAFRDGENQTPIVECRCSYPRVDREPLLPERRAVALKESSPPSSSEWVNLPEHLVMRVAWLAESDMELSQEPLLGVILALEPQLIAGD